DGRCPPRGRVWTWDSPVDWPAPHERRRRKPATGAAGSGLAEPDPSLSWLELRPAHSGPWATDFDVTTPSVLHRPTDRPPRPERLGAGTTLSLAAHVALVGALWWGVHWRTAPTEAGTTAELWAAVPEIAAPPPTVQPEAPPPPAPA